MSIASDIVAQKLFQTELIIHIRWYSIIDKVNTQAPYNATPKHEECNNRGRSRNIRRHHDSTGSLCVCAFNHPRSYVLVLKIHSFQISYRLHYGPRCNFMPCRLIKFTCFTQVHDILLRLVSPFTLSHLCRLLPIVINKHTTIQFHTSRIGE